MDVELARPPNPDADNMAQRWRTTALVLGSLAALLTALGPLTAWINGVQDRALQEKRAQDQMSLQYMDLLLRSGTPEEREMKLRFLEKALRAERPRDLMLEVATEQLAELDKIPKLEAAITASTKRTRDLEAELSASQAREQLAWQRAESAIDSATAKQLQSDLATERQNRSKLQHALEAERQQNTELKRQLDRTQAASGTVPEPSYEERRDQYLNDLELPEDQVALLRKLDTLCASYGGRSLFVYFDRDQPGVNCSLGSNQFVALDADSIKVKRLFLDRPTGDPHDPMTEYQRCARVGGVPMFTDKGSSILCKVKETGRGVQIPRF